MKQGGHLTKPGWSNPIPIPHPTNLALFGHKITLYRFNQGAHTITGGSNRSRGAEPPGFSHFNHWYWATLMSSRTWTVKVANRVVWHGKQRYRPQTISATACPYRPHKMSILATSKQKLIKRNENEMPAAWPLFFMLLLTRTSRHLN